MGPKKPKNARKSAGSPIGQNGRKCDKSFLRKALPARHATVGVIAAFDTSLGRHAGTGSGPIPVMTVPAAGAARGGQKYSVSCMNTLYGVPPYSLFRMPPDGFAPHGT